MQLKNFLKSPAKQIEKRSYLVECTRACATREGAAELAARLTRDKDATSRTNPLHHMFRPQIEAALHAGEHAKVMHDIDVRVPENLKRAEAAANAIKEQAKNEITTGERAADVAATRLTGYKSQLEAVQIQRDGVRAQTSQALSVARQALDAARDAEDVAVIEKAANDLVAEQGACTARAAELEALELRMAVLGDLVKMADDGHKGALEQLERGDVLLRACEARLLAMEADRATLHALLAHVRWRNLLEALPESSFPAGVDGVSFFFHEVENVPLLWDGKRTGAYAIATWPLQRIRSAMREPDFSVFAIDPSVDEAAVPPTSATEN